MRRSYGVPGTLLVGSLGLGVAPPAWAQGSAGHAMVRNAGDMKFDTFPVLPGCTRGAGLSGNPETGPFILLAKADAGCTVPWHWHTAAEHLMMVKGTARLDVKGGAPMTLREGGYAMLPGKHAHQFVCTRACEFYVHSDGAFDIHYVDAQGKEVPMAEALEGVKRAPRRKDR